MNEERKNVEQMPPQETPEEQVPNTPQSDNADKSAFGPIAGIAIIVIVLIVGGVYLWMTATDQDVDESQLPVIQSGGEAEAIVNQLNTQGTSDEIADIEADLNTTELENLDSELDDLLNEL